MAFQVLFRRASSSRSVQRAEPDAVLARKLSDRAPSRPARTPLELARERASVRVPSFGIFREKTARTGGEPRTHPAGGEYRPPPFAVTARGRSLGQSIRESRDRPHRDRCARRGEPWRGAARAPHIRGSRLDLPALPRSIGVAKPKSTRRTRPSRCTTMLRGFTSRWTRPTLCTAPSAATRCTARSSVSSSFAERAATELVGEGLPLDEFHDDVWEFVDLADFENGRQPRVAYARERDSLAVDPSCPSAPDERELNRASPRALASTINDGVGSATELAFELDAGNVEGARHAGSILAWTRSARTERTTRWGARAARAEDEPQTARLRKRAALRRGKRPSRREALRRAMPE
jgi:hypothetical protein